MRNVKYALEGEFMNILLLGHSDSVFTRDFCVRVLGKENIQTVVLTPSSATKYGQDYEANHIKEIRWPEVFLKGIRNQSGALKAIIKAYRDLKETMGFENEIDVLHVHYVEPMHLIYFFGFWMKAKKRVLTFWGSDLLRASKKKLLLFPYFLKHSTSIVLMIQNQCDYFQEVFGHKYDDKIHIIDFGNSLLDVIDDVMQKHTVEECKQHFELPLDKIIVHVGYNASRGQQHMEMLESIVSLPQDVINKIKFVFHISYGYGSDFNSYKQQLTELMDAAQLDYSFYDAYLQGEELAMFRMTCDVFLYGQKTDARSASPLEYIYAGTEFVCPKWLSGNYELLDQAGINYFVYDDFTHLPDTLQECFKGVNPSERKISQEGREAIRKEISWDSLAEKWRNLYE